MQDKKYMIRTANKKDASRIHELLIYINQLHHANRPDIYNEVAKYSIAEIEQLIIDPSYLLIVAVNENDKVVAYSISKFITVKDDGPIKGRHYLYLDDLCVDPDYQRQHLAKKIMDEVIKKAQVYKQDAVELNVYAFNQNARAFYQNYGFKDQKIQMELTLKNNPR